MPPKRRKYRSKEPNYIRLQQAKRTAERRANMTEAERNLEREKNRIAAKLRRAIMEPEAREKFLEKQREEKRAKRRELRIKGLQEELKIIEWQLDTLQGQGEAANVGEKSELESRRGQLEQQIQEIRDSGKAEQEQSLYRLAESQDKDEGRGEITEEEEDKEIALEKRRISRNSRRASKAPEEREKILEKQRVEKRIKRRELKIKRLQEELAIVESELYALEEEGEVGNDDAEKLDLETRRDQLELKIQELRDSDPNETPRKIQKSESSRIQVQQNNQRRADRRAKMSEEEKDAALEKRRIARKERRANIPPEEREKVLEKERVEKRIKRRELKIKELQDQLELLDLELYNLEEEEEAGNDAEKLRLETRRDELELKLQEICDSDPNEKLRNNNIRSESSYNRISGKEKKAERRANMTEAEKNLEREKNRISAKLRRALRDPVEQEKVKEKTREKKRIKRSELKIKSLREELKIIEVQLGTCQEGKKLELENRMGQLELQIRGLINTIETLQSKRTQNLDESISGTNSTAEDDEGTSDLDLDLSSDSDSEDDPNADSFDLADLTYKAAEGAVGVDPSGLLELTMLEDEDTDQKMRPNETIQEWVERVSATTHTDNTPEVGPEGSLREKDRKNIIEDPQRRRLIVMKAKARLVKLQKPRGRETKVEKQDRYEKLAEQKLFILKLMEKYPEEFNLRVAQNQTKDRRQRRREIAAITRNNNNSIQPKKIGGSSRAREHMRFPRPLFETEAQRIDRIVQKIKSKGANLTNVNETPEELAARIFKEVQEAKEKYMMRKQQANTDGPNTEDGGITVTPGGKRRNLDACLEAYRVRKLLETPEERAIRTSKRAFLARENYKMERGEFNLFQLLTTSQNPSKSLEDDVSAPEILKYWEHFKYTPASARKLPNCLKECRKKTYFLLNEKGLVGVNESEEEKNLRFDRQNDDLKKWLEVNGGELRDYLTKRQQRMHEYYENSKKKISEEMTEEEQEARRRLQNEKNRQDYLKKKLAQGLPVSPKGERPYSNKNYKTNPGLVKKKRSKGERRSRYSELGSGPVKRRKRSSPKAKMSLHPSLKTDPDCTDSSSYDMSHAVPNHESVNTASMYGHSSTGGNHQSLTWQMPTLGLANVSSVEEDHRHEDEQDDGDDDWTPPPNYNERAFEPPINHSHQHQQQFVGNQFLGVHTNAIQNSQHQTGYDELFHRLIGIPSQNHFNAFGSQPQNYQSTGLTGTSSVIQPNPVPFHQHHYHQMQQHQTHNQNIAQSSYVPLNYSVSLMPQSEVEVPWVSETNDCATMGTNFVGSSTINPKEAGHLPRTRRPNGSRSGPKQTPRSADSSKGAVLIATTSTPVVLESAGTTREKKGLRCTYCPMIFHTTRMCQIHMKKTHELKGKYSCKVCPQVFESKTRMIQHYWGIHRKRRPLKCPACSKEYLDRLRFLNHLKVHPSERNSYILGISTSKFFAEPEKFCCDVCPASFDSYLRMINHRQEHKYICTVCGIILKDGDHLLEHTMRCHPEVDWRTKMQEDLYRPVENSGNTFICETCYSEFLTQKFLSLHQERGHPTIEMKSWQGFHCESCDARLRSVQQRDRHMTTTCPLQNFKCYWCKEVFDQDNMRLKHMMKNHLDVKSIPTGTHVHGAHTRVKCELCRRSFYSILKLRHHFVTKHIPNTKRNKPHKPDEVGKSVETIAIDNMETEVNDVITTNETIPSNQKTNVEVAEDSRIVDQNPPQTASVCNEASSTVTGPIVVHPCNICQSKFKTQEFLEKHVDKEHQGSSHQYRFPCNVCNKCFVNPQVLRRHIQSYHSSTDNKTNQCPHCITKFARAEYLRTHIKTIHESSDPLVEAKYLHRLMTKEKNKQYKCDTCQLCFMHERGLTEHRKRAHGPAIAPVFCEICGKQIETLTPDYCLKAHMKRHHPEISDTLVQITSTASTVSFGQGSVLKRLPLPEVMELIDEVYRLWRYHNPKKPRMERRVKRSRSKNKSPQKSEVNEAKEREELEESDRDWFTGDSVSDNSDDSDDFEESESSDPESDSGNDSTADVHDAAKRRKISMKNIVINPKKRKTNRVSPKLDSNFISTASTSSINLERYEDDVKIEKLSEPGPSRSKTIRSSRSRQPAEPINSDDSDSENSSDVDDYEDKTVNISDADYSKPIRKPYSSKRFIMDVDGDKNVSDNSESDHGESQEEYSDNDEGESG